MSKGYKYGVFTLDMNSDYGVLVYKDKALAEKCYKTLFKGTYCKCINNFGMHLFVYFYPSILI